MKSNTKLSNFEFPHLEMDLKKVLYAPNIKGEIEYEIWKDIPDYEEYYQVSTFGRVKSLERNVIRGNHKFKVNEKILQQQNPQKYFTIGFKKENKFKSLQVHQLIAITFLGHVPNGFISVIDHIDNDKLNNRLDNLQITTNRHNASKDKTGGTSKYLGVAWMKNRNKWRAVIYHNGKDVHLGVFTNEREASKYYQNALKAINNNKEIVVKSAEYTSKVVGIGYRKDHEVWTARILVDGKRKHIGNFKTEQQAIGALEHYKSLNN